MAAQRHEISLRVLKNILRVSAPFELFYDELKVTKCCTKTFCLCWLLRSKIAFMRCETFSNVLYVFYIIHEELIRASLHFSMSQQICISNWNHKICRKATTFRLFSISRTLCQTVYKFQASSFDELRFFPRAGMLCLVKCDEGRFSSSVFTSLCWRMLCFKAL